VERIPAVTSYYSSIADESKQLLTLWDEMKVEIRYTQQQERQIKREKDSQYCALEEKLFTLLPHCALLQKSIPSR
jgi:hypothetical protein